MSGTGWGKRKLIIHKIQYILFFRKEGRKEEIKEGRKKGRKVKRS
jgi:hypothetical protein